MTRKEEIRQRIANLQKEYHEVTGEFISNQYEYRRNAKVYELEEEENRIQKCLDAAILKKKREAYWQTAEGAQRKKTLEAAQEAIWASVMELTDRRQNAFTRAIQTILDVDWICKWADDYSFEFCRVDADKKPIFGSDFEVRVRGFAPWDKRECIEINTGTMGSFPLDSERALFYKDFAKFLGAIDEKSFINLAKHYASLIKEKQAEFRAIEKELDNPFVEVKNS